MNFMFSFTIIVPLLHLVDNKYSIFLLFKVYILRYYYFTMPQYRLVLGVVDVALD